jgi:N utilization substance protein B
MLYMSEFYEKDELDRQLELYFENSFFAENEIRDEETANTSLPEFKELKAELLARFAKVRDKIGVIDPMIASVSSGWRLDRMGRVDLQIMRLAVYEIFYDPEVPSAVAINEALNLAKKYGSSEDAGSFINGILGKLEKTRAAEEG